MKQVLAALAGFTVMIGVAGCGDDDNPSRGNGTSPSPQIIEVTAEDFSFTPSRLGGTMGAPIDITFKNAGEVPHTFTIDEFNVDTEVPAGEETTLTMLPPEPGEFNYYCRFHKDRGMLGAISTTGEGGDGAAATDSPDEAPTEEPYEY